MLVNFKSKTTLEIAIGSTIAILACTGKYVFLLTKYIILKHDHSINVQE